MIALAKYAIMAGFVGTFLGGVLVVFMTWLDRELRNKPAGISTRSLKRMLLLSKSVTNMRKYFGRL